MLGFGHGAVQEWNKGLACPKAVGEGVVEKKKVLKLGGLETGRSAGTCGEMMEGDSQRGLK